MKNPESAATSPSRALLRFVIVALSTAMFLQKASSDDRFVRSSVLQPRSTNAWNPVSLQPRSAAPWPTQAKDNTSGPRIIDASSIPAVRPYAPAPSTVQYDDAQASAQPDHGSYLPTSQSHPITPSPVVYDYASGSPQPNTASQVPAPQTYAPRSWPVSYSNLQDGGETNATVPAMSSSRGRTSRSGSGRSLETGGPFISTLSFCYWNDDLYIDGKAEVPVLGRMNVAEHNSPLPRDRAYFIYKLYNSVLNNSVSDSAGNLLAQSTRSVDEYLVGYERTFHDECFSLELRMPFYGTGNSQFDAGFSSNDPSIGNFALIAKGILYRGDRGAVSAGCGLTMPTGDDTVFSVGDQTFTILNDTPHFIPFVGMLKQSADQCWYALAFAGLDIPIRGNRIQFVDPVDGGQNLGRLEDQDLLYLDFTLGRWLYRNPDCDTWTGFAVQTELHYAGTLNGAHRVEGVLSGVNWNTGYSFGCAQNQFDSTFASVVLQAELKNKTDVRVGGIFPMNGANSRFFDSELVLVITQRF